jgi:uncharacterized glyoxalase superfamily protein PhnB
MEWTNVSPVFPVADVAVSVAWYGRMFDFEPRIVNPPDDVPVYAVLSRDAVSIHLLQQDETPHGLTRPVQAQFWVSDGLDALFARVTALGVAVIQAPEDRPWGHRDFMVADPDGNIIWVTVRLTAR